MNLLVVEDNPRVGASLKKGLQENGYVVTLARKLSEARTLAVAGAFDLVLLDLNLPDGDGMDFLTELRKRTQRMPVLVLTARDDVSDRVHGLDSGADDYLVKPFSFPELLARLKVLLRRAQQSDDRSLRVGDLVVDLVARAVARGDKTIELTPREFDVLAYLARAQGDIVSRETLAKQVWRINSRATPLDNVIDVHMTHLREKIDKGFPTRLLHTVRGVGFVLKCSS